jgi:hypothetical protein
MKKMSDLTIKPLSNHSLAFTLVKNDDFFGLVLPAVVSYSADGPLFRTILADSNSDPESNNDNNNTSMQSGTILQKSALEEFELSKSLSCKIHHGCCKDYESECLQQMMLLGMLLTHSLIQSSLNLNQSPKKYSKALT